MMMSGIRNPFALSRPFIYQGSRLRFLRTVSTTSATHKSPKIDLRAITEEEAKKSGLLISLHRRLKLPSELSLATLSRCLTCRSTQNDLLHNEGLNILGKNLLSYYTSEYLLVKYPRLPTAILNAAVDSYLSSDSLATIATQSWGIEVDKTEKLEKYLKNEPVEYSYGKLRFVPLNNTGEKGVTKLSGERLELDTTVAYALAVRSVIGALYASTKSDQVVKEFIYDHILSRKLDISKMFEFEQPTREVSRLCEREGLEAPQARLTAENGRLSKRPTFVISIFSGENRIGESYGSSIKEAKIRASVNALKSWYLYSPLDQRLPSDESYKPGIIDHGVVIV